MNDRGFEVWGTYLLDRSPKLISAHETAEAAQAEIERIKKLRVMFWDGPCPLYRDVEIKASDDAIAALFRGAMLVSKALAGQKP